MMINRHNMTIKIKYNVYFRTACIALFSLIFTSCTKDKLEEFDPGNATGKMVMVSEFFNEDDPDFDHSLDQKMSINWVESWEVVLADEEHQ